MHQQYAPVRHTFRYTRLLTGITLLIVAFLQIGVFSVIPGRGTYITGKIELVMLALVLAVIMLLTAIWLGINNHLKLIDNLSEESIHTAIVHEKKLITLSLEKTDDNNEKKQLTKRLRALDQLLLEPRI